MPKIKDVLLLHHSHLDIGYTHPQPVILELQKDYLDQMLDLCEQTQDWPEESRFRWTCESSSVVLRWLETASARQVERFRHFLQAGQVSVSATYFHTTPLCGPEQMVRTLAPIARLRDVFGVELTTAVHHDVNGQPWPYAQLLLDAGVEFFVMGVNIHMGGLPMPRPQAFHWQAPDGRPLLTYHGEHYAMFPQICQLDERDTAGIRSGLDRYLSRIEQRDDYPFDFVYMTSTNLPLYDNNPPDASLASIIRRWNAEGHEEALSFVTPEQLHARVKPHAAELATYAGDWTDYWNFGSGSSATEVRLNRKTKAGLKAVELLDAVAPDDHPSHRALTHRAWEQLNLFEEHTWGAFNSVSEPDKLDVAIQWSHKAHYAHEANSLTGYLLSRKLESVAGNPHQSDTPEGILLVNASPVAKDHELRFPAAHREPGKHLAANRMRFVPMNREGTRTGASYGVVRLEPFSWMRIPFDSMEEADASPDLVVGDGVIETPTHRCVFDPVSGRITELHDRRTGWQVIDSSSPYSFFEYVQETIDTSRAADERETFFPTDIPAALDNISVWNHDWPARRTSATPISCSIERGPDSATLVIRSDAPGARDLEQRITFFAYSGDIELRASFVKDDVRTPEGTYFAFPLNLGEWRAHFDTAGHVVEFEAEQLPTACRDFVTVDKQVSVHDADHGVTLACPDAPLVQIGGFHFGTEARNVRRDPNPLLLAWPMNNYWDTNFRASQPGPVSFTYVLSTFGHFDAASAARAGVSAASRVFSVPAVHCPEEATGTWLRCVGDGVVVFDVAPAQQGDAFIVRLMNVLSRPTEALLSLPGRGPVKAGLVDVREDAHRSSLLAGDAVDATSPDGEIRIPLAARAMVHLRIEGASS